MQIKQSAILVPLVVGVGATVLTIGIHAIALATVVHLVRHARRLGHFGASFSINLMVTITVILLRARRTPW
jgi:hypothetical protein